MAFGAKKQFQTCCISSIGYYKSKNLPVPHRIFYEKNGLVRPPSKIYLLELNENI